MRMEKKSKILIFALLGLFLTTLLIGVASAQTSNSTIARLVADWKDKNLDVNIAQWLFIVLITLLVYSIVDLTGIVGQWYIRLPVSIVIGFLSGAYIAPDEIFAMLASYNTLGIILGGFLPLVILILFTYSITVKEATGNSVTVAGGGILVQYLIWLGFAAVLIYKTIVISISEQASQPLLWLNLGITLAVIIFGIIFNSKLRDWFVHIQGGAMETRYNRRLNQLEQGLGTLFAAQRATEAGGQPTTG